MVKNFAPRATVLSVTPCCWTSSLTRASRLGYSGYLWKWSWKSCGCPPGTP